MIAAEAVHQHTSQDLLFVAVSIGLALVGSFAALVSAIRIPLSRGRARFRWTVSAAVSLGGGAIWSMHFIGMMGYHVDGLDLRYDLPRTGLSLVIAVAVSALGLTLVARRPRSTFWLALSGVIAGLGVAAMHYTGMAAMNVGGSVTYRREPVVISIVIAVIAALAALWIAFRVRTGWHVALASVVMAAAVCGMHYTAMSATRVQAGPPAESVPGTDPISLGLLVCVLAFSVLAVVIFTALGGVTEAGSFSMAREGSRHRRPAGGGDLVSAPALSAATGRGTAPARPGAWTAPSAGGDGGWDRSAQLRARAERPAPPEAFRTRESRGPSTAQPPDAGSEAFGGAGPWGEPSGGWERGTAPGTVAADAGRWEADSADVGGRGPVPPSSAGASPGAPAVPIQGSNAGSDPGARPEPAPDGFAEAGLPRRRPAGRPDEDPTA